ncbi:MAG: peptidase domain-containing ABC transporter, partial [Ktedonobacteraceae bacterium]|nr:peptidase domain-containing ABC transporter [Ktedonobacteraceae bacterium]
MSYIASEEQLEFDHNEQDSAGTATGQVTCRGRRRAWLRLPRRVPFVMQMNAIECGAACLAMILGYHGRQTRVAEIRDVAGIGRDGLSALQIVQTARAYGLNARALTLPTSDLHHIPLPAIVHWEFNHFVVVERWTPSSVVVLDPASDRKCLSAREFDEGFTGIIMMFEPGENFMRCTYKPDITLKTYILRTFQRSPILLLQILGASLILQLLGLSFPLLTQIIVDRILPQHMISVLPILGIGLLIIPLAQLVTML